MELKDTVELMLSNDMKERLAGEYWQTKIRAVKLQDFLSNRSKAKGPYLTTNQITMLTAQSRVMTLYLEILEDRAKDMGIDFHTYCK